MVGMRAVFNGLKATRNNILCVKVLRKTPKMLIKQRKSSKITPQAVDRGVQRRKTGYSENQRNSGKNAIISAKGRVVCVLWLQVDLKCYFLCKTSKKNTEQHQKTVIMVPLCSVIYIYTSVLKYSYSRKNSQKNSTFEWWACRLCSLASKRLEMIFYMRNY